MVNRKEQFFKSVTNLLNQLNSSHPFDKQIIQQLLDGGFEHKDVEDLRELILKASKAYYSGQKEKEQQE